MLIELLVCLFVSFSLSLSIPLAFLFLFYFVSLFPLFSLFNFFYCFVIHPALPCLSPVHGGKGIRFTHSEDVYPEKGTSTKGSYSAPLRTSGQAESFSKMIFRSCASRSNGPNACPEITHILPQRQSQQHCLACTRSWD